MSPRSPHPGQGSGGRGRAAPQTRALARLPAGGRARARPAAGPGRSGGLGGEQVEGRRAVRELLAAPGNRAMDVWVADDLEGSAAVEEIARMATERRVPVRRVPRGRLEAEARTDAAQGVLAHARPLEEVDLDRLGRRGAGPAPFLVAVDGVTDPHNLGAILRSAACAGATGVVLPRHRAVHVTPTAAKAASGAVEHLAMALVPGIPAALDRLSELGVWSVGLDAGARASLYELDLADQPLALVLGAEGKGLGRLTRRRCDVVAAIPQDGPLGSLNVAAAAAVACFEIARRRRLAGPQPRPG